MKKSIIFSVVLLIIALTPSIIFADWVVCIDAGHGGPGADKYHNGGDGHGNSGSVLGIAEQWVNLNVALALRDSIIFSGFLYTVKMTRQYEADPDLPTNWDRNLWYRSNIANYAKKLPGQDPDIFLQHADQFISIHHNGVTGNDSVQGTQVFWSSQQAADSGYSRCYAPNPVCRDSMLSWKIHLQLMQAWHYDNRCFKSLNGCLYCCDSRDGYAVLRRTVMPSALSESSFLRYPAEELLFNDPNMVHTNQEAGAIFQGWVSYIEWGGVSCVSYVCQSNYTGRMLIDGDTVITPQYKCWVPGETHTLQAQDTLDWGIHYKFTHWSQELLGQGVDPRSCWINTSYDTIWSFIVPQGENSYYAYMKGGPYRDTIYYPSGGEVWSVGQVQLLRWGAFEGADTTTLIDLLYSTNGGSTWEIIETGLPVGSCYPGDLCHGSWYWTVQATPSTKCRVKVRAYDCAGNDTFNISASNFTINCAPKPNTPTNLTASNYGCDARITLNWHDNSTNEEGFNIYRNGVWLASAGANVTSFTQTNLVTGQNYSYYVKAYIGDCESEVSNTVTQTPSLLAPDAPANLQVVNIGPCQFQATWEDNSYNEDGFVLYNGIFKHAMLGPNITSYQGYYYPEAEWKQTGDFYVYAYNGGDNGDGCRVYSNHVNLDPPGGLMLWPIDIQFHGSGCYWYITWQKRDNYDRCQVKIRYTDYGSLTGCDEQYTYWYTELSSPDSFRFLPTVGDHCYQAQVRGGKWVNCGSYGDTKWSEYQPPTYWVRINCTNPPWGCPYLFVPDGEKFIGENTILAPAEMSTQR
jgi:N-acetylmuramoyl-L-alanine amidase